MSEHRSTPAGEHRPVLLREILEFLDPRPGEVVVDCTLGYAGHARELLQKVGPTGRLIGIDLDAANLPAAREKLSAVSHPYSVHHGNFAGVARVIGEESLEGVDVLLADLGMSSMQVDDLSRGFSYMRDGPLDMRMDPTRGRTASELLFTSPEEELAEAFRDFGDEPMADVIAAAIVKSRSKGRLVSTWQLSNLIQQAAPVKINPHPLPGDPKPWQQKIRPVARVFQAMRILVNRELANLKELLRVLPSCLNPGGRVAIISFHSGEDRLVKAAFKESHRTGVFEQISDDPVRANYTEKNDNRRSRSAKLRWAKRSS